MDIYDGADLTLLIDGATPDCLENVSLNETISFEPDARDADGWDTFRPNLQEFTINLSGQNEGGYAVLLAIKRSFSRIGWQINTTDANITNSGSGYITEISRSEPADGNQTFNATIRGYGAIV